MNLIIFWLYSICRVGVPPTVFNWSFWNFAVCGFNPQINFCHWLIGNFADALDRVRKCQISFSFFLFFSGFLIWTFLEDFRKAGHRGVQLILAYSWARPAILVAGKGRGGMFLFLLFLHFHSCSSFFPVPLFHLFDYLFYHSSPFLWETTQNDPQGLTCR